MNIDDIKTTEALIRLMHLQGKLPELLGKALGIPAVFIVLIQKEGEIQSQGNCEKGGEFHARNHSMLVQMTNLLASNMNAMMQEAGKVQKEHKTGSREPVGDEEMGAFVFCKQHLRVHSTGWCTVDATEKVALEGTTSEAALADAQKKGLIK